MDYQNKTAFITAGASGMGKRFAEQVVERGGNVVIADVDMAAANRLASELGGLAVECNVRSTEQVDAARDAALERFGNVDIVMSHAGITKASPIVNLTDDDWTVMFDLNVIGMARVLRAFIPHLTERGSGHVIMTTSSLALIPGHPLGPLTAHYIASKAAVIGLAQVTALALAPHDIGVTLFSPDLTKTNFGTPPPGVERPKGVMALERQTPEQAVDVLLDALDNGRFLASATPDYERLLAKQAAVLLDPLAFADEYPAPPSAAPAAETAAETTAATPEHAPATPTPAPQTQGA
ncbi:SDR family oxidoreductase [Subtercola lobariae]|uniref:Short-chain dehydrogenase n=1 Tax=Subtercola lobariae TaxID=1588641 RepID=A0A917EWK3_9MICO|nr:SDR family oxidoreductase [Subtercola lobariae]GGF15638.1 short-chain dehydrogenase [Subtercola lobariae]